MLICPLCHTKWDSKGRGQKAKGRLQGIILNLFGLSTWWCNGLVVVLLISLKTLDLSVIVFDLDIKYVHDVLIPRV